MRSESELAVAPGAWRALQAMGAARAAGWLPYAVLLAAGGALAWLDAAHPGGLPAWMPWEFSWAVFLATFLTLGWFVRGLALAPPAERPALWRRAAFVAGVLSLYAVSQTRIDYVAQHMFFVHRLQHIVLHHLGPFLIAISGVGATLRAGLPAPLARAVASRPVARAMRVVQQPALAAFLFVGLIYFWLIPAVHFRAMLDARLYAVMNWSMAVDGILFWCLVLDSRPRPPARVGFGTRILLAFVVILPQIVLGAILSFSTTDLFSVYALCGRIYDMSALADQHMGGLILWIPGAMMSVVAVLCVLNAMRMSEDRMVNQDERARAMAAAASRWTGR